MTARKPLRARQPWVTAYRGRRTNRTMRCGYVLDSGWRCRLRVGRGGVFCILHRDNDGENTP